MLNHLIWLQGFVDNLCPDPVHRIIDRILALYHLQVTMSTTTHLIYCGLISAILAALNVVFDFAGQTLRLRHRHRLHHSLNTCEAPVEYDLCFFLVVRHSFLYSSECIPPQLLGLLLQKDQVCLVERPSTLNLLNFSPPIGALLDRRLGHILGWLRRWGESFVHVGRYLVVRVFKSLV